MYHYQSCWNLKKIEFNHHVLIKKNKIVDTRVGLKTLLHYYKGDNISSIPESIFIGRDSDEPSRAGLVLFFKRIRGYLGMNKKKKIHLYNLYVL